MRKKDRIEAWAQQTNGARNRFYSNRQICRLNLSPTRLNLNALYISQSHMPACPPPCFTVYIICNKFAYTHACSVWYAHFDRQRSPKMIDGSLHKYLIWLRFFFSSSFFEEIFIRQFEGFIVPIQVFVDVTFVCVCVCMSFSPTDISRDQLKY